jgi:outer membrane protein TolC
MRASNSLIAVGISTVVLFGATSAASAQAEPAAETDSVNAKERARDSYAAEVQDTQNVQHVQLAQGVQNDRKLSDPKQEPASQLSETLFETRVARDIPTSQSSQNTARIEIFVAPDAPSQTLKARTGTPDSTASSIASSLQTTPQVASAKAAPVLNLAQAPAEVDPEEAERAEERLPTLSDSAEAGTVPETTRDSNETAEGAAEGVAPETVTTEELSPAATEAVGQANPAESNQEEQASPAVEDNATPELEQQGEETENSNPEENEVLDDQPPQDTEENIAPADGEPVPVVPSEPSDEAQPTDETQSPLEPSTGGNEIQPGTPLEDAATAGSAPEYLDTDANPLLFPTTPEEVRLLGTQPVTLKQAIEAGLRNNEELQATRLELQRLRAVLRETQASEYPEINANAQLNYSANEQGISVPVTNEQGLPTGETEADTDVARSLALGGAIELSYSIFTSGRRPALIQAAERQVRFQELQVEADTEDLILQITGDYYDLQEADEQVQIFRATLEEAQRSLRDAEALERAGVGTRFDVLQAQVDVANALQNLRSQQSQQEIARRQLAERLNLNQTLTLAAADPIEVAGEWNLSLEETIVAAYRNRAELEQQLVQREIAERNRRAALAQLGPQLTFQTSYGLNNTLESDPDSPAEEVGFLSEFQAALGVNMILFDGGAARAQARQAEANMAIAESSFANQRDQIRFNVERAYAELQSNNDNIQTTALAVQQAIEALRLARLRFQAGVGTQTDVLQAQTALTQARFNNLQAILDYNRALSSLQRQVSNYPEGYLNEVP